MLMKALYHIKYFAVSYTKVGTDYPLRQNQFFYMFPNLNAHKILLPVDFVHLMPVAHTF